MTDWTSMDLVPSPAWRGGPTRMGLAVGPTGLWVALIDPAPEAPRLTLLQHESLPGLHTRGQLDAASRALSTLRQEHQIPEGDVGVALGTGVISGLQEAAPMPDTELADGLLGSGLADHAVWEGGTPVLAPRVLSRTATKTRLLYAGTSQATHDAWQQTLADGGMRLAGIEPFPLAVLRGLIAVGDLEPTGRWGLAIVSQDRCWVSLWSDDELILWREHPAPALDTTAEPDPEDLLVLTRTIKAAWRFGGITPDTKLWLVADTPEMASLLEGILHDQHLPVEVPLHARLGPLAAGGAGALAAVGEGAASVLAFPSPLWLRHQPPEQPRWPHRALPAAIAAAGLLVVGLAGYAILSSSSERIAHAPPRPAPSPTSGDMRPITAGAAPGWPLATILSQVSRQIPQDAWLTTLDVGEDGRLTIAGEAMAIRSPLLYSWSLTQLPGWSHVRLAELVNQGDTYRFTVEATLDATTLIARSQP